MTSLRSCLWNLEPPFQCMRIGRRIAERITSQSDFFPTVPLRLPYDFAAGCKCIFILSPMWSSHSDLSERLWHFQHSCIGSGWRHSEPFGKLRAGSAKNLFFSWDFDPQQEKQILRSPASRGPQNDVIGGKRAATVKPQ